MLKIAIIGRPNVGKSTLFNRLVGKKIALVDDLPGVTRDKREGIGNIAGMEFALLDTAGLEEAAEGSLSERMMQQTAKAADEADLVLFMVDGKEGFNSLDKNFSSWLRKKNKPVILVANKCESKKTSHNLHDFYQLGFGEPIGISAEHGEAMADLYEAIAPFHNAAEEILEEETDDETIRIAIIGRPNAGKSTLVNRILGEERVLTGPEAGITRDSIEMDLQYKGHNFKIIDTAGIRRKNRVSGKLEHLAVGDSLRSIQFCHIAILMIDANYPFEKQDLMLAAHVISEGRGLIIAANKWDLVEDRNDKIQELYYMLEKSLGQVKGVKLVPISALQGDNINKLLDAVFEIYDLWNERIPTNALNLWIKKAVEKHNPPTVKNNKRIKIKYITQVKTRPPSFALFVNEIEKFPDSYERYLINSLRTEFGIPAVPIRFMLRKSSKT